MYSVWDKENKRYMNSGKNSEMKEEAIAALVSLFEPELEPEFLTEPLWAQAEEFENMGFEFEQHSEKKL